MKTTEDKHGYEDMREALSRQLTDEEIKRLDPCKIDWSQLPPEEAENER